MPYKDPEQRKAYGRAWLIARRDAWIAEHGPCQSCGATENLNIDHIDPGTKVEHRVFSWSQERRDEELAKCQVLCQPCHQRKTAEDNGWHIPFEHGSNGTYNRGCRCPRCRQANAERERKYYTAEQRHAKYLREKARRLPLV